GLRAQKKISPKQTLSVSFEGSMPEELWPMLAKLANVKVVEGAAGESVTSFIVGTVKCSVSLEGLVDDSEERSRLEAELARQKGFLEGVRRKLGNENFIAHAPEAVVAVERKKEADAQARIEALEKSLEALAK
ncbi:MAG: valine--tRNA ligase, partial [Bacteroidales bacterium]|nr:valine--tRNA ligase [Bacteroidales bacterium]